MVIFQQQNLEKTVNHMLSYNQSSNSSESPLSNQPSFLEKQFSKLIDKHPQFTLEQSFHFEYCKLYLQNIRLNSQIDKVKQQIQELQQLCPINLRPKLLSHQLSQDFSNSDKKKRIRRTANQIARHYVCKVQKCQKTYGSEGSLNQHIKLKHKDIFKGNYQ